MSDGALMMSLLGFPVVVGLLFLIRRLTTRRKLGSGVGRLFGKRRL